MNSEKRPIDSYSQDEIIELWAQKLESGQLKQGKHRLCNKDGLGGVSYCCLGVVCELYIELGGDLEKVEYQNHYGYNEEGHDLSRTGVLPREVQDWIGMNTNEGRYIDRQGYPIASLVADNDSFGRNFEQIARIIRSRPKGLFISKE